MILKDISIEKLAKAYFPNCAPDVATKKFADYLKDINPKWAEKAQLISEYWGLEDFHETFSKDDIVKIGMAIGYPRRHIVDDICDTITYGYNCKNMEDGNDTEEIIDAYRKFHTEPYTALDI